MFYVVAYDSPNQKRRSKIAATLEGYGQRVQYSVFECYLSPSHYAQLRRRLRKWFNPEEDSIRFYPLSSQMLAQVEIWGGRPLSSPPGSVIL